MSEQLVWGIGIDLIEISRVERALTRRNKLVKRIFTEAEIEYCQRRGRPGASFAARFAAKEAVRKACSTGMPWKEIEVVSRGGKPLVRLSGKAADCAAGMGITRIELSLSHNRESAVAVALALTSGDGSDST